MKPPYRLWRMLHRCKFTFTQSQSEPLTIQIEKWLELHKKSYPKGW